MWFSLQPKPTTLLSRYTKYELKFWGAATALRGYATMFGDVLTLLSLENEIWLSGTHLLGSF